MLQPRNLFLLGAGIFAALATGRWWIPIAEYIGSGVSQLLRDMKMWSLELDKFVTGIGVSPTFLLLALALAALWFEWPRIIAHVRRHRENKAAFEAEFRSRDQYEAGSTIMGVCKKFHESNPGRDTSQTFGDFLRSKSLPAGLPLTNSGSLRSWIRVACEELPGTDWHLWIMVKNLYPGPSRPDPKPDNFEGYRNQLTKFWDKWGRALDKNNLDQTDPDIRRMVGSVAEDLKLLVYLELAQVRDADKLTGPGKSGLFSIANRARQFAVSLESSNGG